MTTPKQLTAIILMLVAASVTADTQTSTSPVAAKEAAPKASEGIQKLFGKTLTNSRKKDVSTDELGGKIVAIYFSAHWCKPCRALTPELVKLHKDVTEQGKSFEIVFVSRDRSESEMYDYMEEADMPWMALPFGDSRKESLINKFKINGIPSLVIVDVAGKTITKNGRADVTSLGAAAFEKWETAANSL